MTAMPNITRVLVSALAALSLAACAGSAGSGKVKEYRGSYSAGFESSAFKPDGKKEVWWANGSPSCPGIFTLRAAGDEMHRDPPVSVRIRGKVSRKGRYGHLGFYDRELEIVETLSCEKLKD